MRKIHLVTDCPFEARDYDRFGIETLQGQGFEYHVWDLSPLIATDRFQTAEKSGKIRRFSGLHLIQEKALALRQLASFTENDAVISILGLRANNYKYIKSLASSSAKLVQLRLGNIPKSHIAKIQNPARRNWISLSKALLARMVKLLSPRELILQRMPASYLGLRPADIVIAAGEVALRSISKTSPTEVVNTISFDYEIYLKTLQVPARPDTDFIVYIDEYTPFHPDWAHVGIAPACTADELYPRLCKFFDQIETVTGKKIVIAAHPRSDYPLGTSYFGQRSLIKGETASLIRNCSFLMVHGSTSVSYATLFQKPMLFMTSKIFSPYERFSISSMAEAFQKVPVFFDEDFSKINLESELRVDLPIYKRYKDRYLKDPSASEEDIWLAFGNHLK